MASEDQAKIVTRFAPSPTGFLHIGGARTALFNWLYARRFGGQFLLRIEDTDQARSTQAAIDAIIDGLRWLGLDWDGEPILQSNRAARHAEVALELLANGHAYRCFATTDELSAMREAQRAAKQPQRYDRRWRDRSPTPQEAEQSFVIRLRAPLAGALTIDDQVQGTVTVQCAELDDFVLLRSDGTPTYMLSVVVDDYDMGVTHIIRGDDHLNNAFRQLVMIQAMGWPEPVYSHVPLIHGADGAKLSKRHGALGVEAYRDELGMLPEAVCNYLLRLGWGHGDDEIISRDQALEWFDIVSVGRSPSRFDLKKLENLNAHYIREAAPARLAVLAQPLIESNIARKLTLSDTTLLARTMPELQPRAKTIMALAEGAAFLFLKRPLAYDTSAQALLGINVALHLKSIKDALQSCENWVADELQNIVRAIADATSLKLGELAQPLRIALTGKTVSLGVFDIMVLLGRDETLLRLDDCIAKATEIAQ